MPGKMIGSFSVSKVRMSSVSPKDKKEADLAGTVTRMETGGMRLERKARNSQAMASLCTLI